MKKLKFTLVILVIFILGIFIGQDYEQYKLEKSHERERKAMINVVVAQRDLNEGEIIDKTSAAFRGIPEKYKTSYSVLPKDFKDVLDGMILNRDLKSGDPILEIFVKPENSANTGEVISSPGLIIAQGHPINIEDEEKIEKTENKDKQWHHDFFQKHVTRLTPLTANKLLFMSDGWNKDLVLRENDKIHKTIDDHGSNEYTLDQIGNDSAIVHYRSEFSHHSFGDNKTTIDEGSFEINYQE